MNIVIVGSGMIASIMAQSIEEAIGKKAYAVYSRSFEKGRIFADKCNIEKVFTDFDEMLNDENVDFIYLATPNSIHYPQAKKAIEAGKNVIVEKPFTSNIKECEDLIRNAEKKDVFLFEAIRTIHTENYKLIKEKLPLLGPIKYVNGTYLQRSSKYDDLLNGKTPNVFSLEYSGGALMDLNLYNIYLVETLLGEPSEVVYDARKHENGIDLGGTLKLDYGTFKAFLTAMKDCAGYNFVEIVGENGYIYINGGPGHKLDFDLVLNNKCEHFDRSVDRSFLYDEVKTFKEIYESNNKEKMFELLENTKMIVRTLDCARKSAGIIFAADNKQ